MNVTTSFECSNYLKMQRNVRMQQNFYFATKKTELAIQNQRMQQKVLQQKIRMQFHNLGCNTALLEIHLIANKNVL